MAADKDCTGRAEGDAADQVVAAAVDHKVIAGRMGTARMEAADLPGTAQERVDEHRAVVHKGRGRMVRTAQDWKGSRHRAEAAGHTRRFVAVGPFGHRLED